jgi:orotidine-5'-phosphate decarboxylase
MNNLQNIDVKDNKYRYINPAQLILALDVADFNQAKTMIEKVKNEVEFFKIGLELMMSGDYFKVIELLKKYDKKIFADLKIYDIANTVASAVKNLAKLSLDLLTIHSASKDIMLRANEYKGEMKIIAVTILTNLDQQDIISMGFDKNLTINDLVLK